jgi:hypothetical protein
MPPSLALVYLGELSLAWVQLIWAFGDDYFFGQGECCRGNCRACCRYAVGMVDGAQFWAD